MYIESLEIQYQVHSWYDRGIRDAYTDYSDNVISYDNIYDYVSLFQLTICCANRLKYKIVVRYLGYQKYIFANYT